MLTCLSIVCWYHVTSYPLSYVSMVTNSTINNGSYLCRVCCIEMTTIPRVTVQWDSACLFLRVTVTSNPFEFVPVFPYSTYRNGPNFCGIQSIKVAHSVIIAVQGLRVGLLFGKNSALISLRLEPFSYQSIFGGTNFVCICSVELIRSIRIAVEWNCTTCKLDLKIKIQFTYTVKPRIF